MLNHNRYPGGAGGIGDLDVLLAGLHFGRVDRQKPGRFQVGLSCRSRAAFFSFFAAEKARPSITGRLPLSACSIYGDVA